MGMYTGLRMKCIVKENFRKNFKDIALYGEWNKSDDTVFNNFGKVSRACFIPCGVLAYMPDDWESTDEILTEYDEKSGIWTFQCSLKNYDSTIQLFFDIVPYFVEHVEMCEYFYEESNYSSSYQLIDNVMSCDNDRYICYYNPVIWKE